MSKTRFLELIQIDTIRQLPYNENIVNVIEVITTSKNIYLAMELITGGELQWHLAQKGVLSEASARFCFQQIIQG